MPPLNVGNQRTWENGGVVLIGSDALENIVEGSIEWMPGLNAEMMQSDRGVLKDTVAGNGQESTMKLSLRVANLMGTNSALTAIYQALSGGGLLSNVDASTGLILSKAVSIRVPQFKGSASYEQIAWTKMRLKLDSYKAGTGEGTSFDTLEVSGKSIEPSPAITEV